MRKFLQILGILFLLLLGTAATGFGIIAYKGHQLDVESKAYVDAAVPVIAAHWDPQALTSRAAPELFAGMDSTAQANLFFQFSLLGPMQHYDGSTGESYVYYGSGGNRITAQYIAHGKFLDGEVTFHILLIKLNGQWKIAGFHVDRS